MKNDQDASTEQSPAAPKPRTRDAEATKARILAAAKREFAKKGFGGARVEVIADKAHANKRMIYHYFESKELLFQTVLENAYVDIRTAERKLNLDHLDPTAALERLVRFTWDYYLKNPEFITLVNSENLHRAKHLKKSEVVKVYSRRFVTMVKEILDRGPRGAGTGKRGGAVDQGDLAVKQSHQSSSSGVRTVVPRIGPTSSCPQ